MRKSEAFPSRFFRAQDLVGKPLTVTVASVDYEDVGDVQKLVMRFQGHERGLVVNATNWDLMTLITKSDDSEDWVGARVTMFAEKVSFRGS
jgi:hypothetical protein